MELCTSCPICADKYTLVARPKVSCEFCDFACCRLCYQKYCIERREPRCMNPSCGRSHASSFFHANITRTFFETTWRDAMKQQLFESEQARFVETQDYIAHVGPAERMVEELGAQVRQRADELRQLERAYDDAMRQLRELRDGFGATKQQENKRNNRWNKRSFPCSSGECRGIVIERECPLCNTRYCEKCHEKANDSEAEHKCDPTTLATMEMISEQTKPCPKCSSRIHKIDGCNMMWCVVCHTAFHWLTGEITRGRIHNPEFFRYLATLGPDAETRYMHEQYCDNGNRHGLPDAATFQANIRYCVPSVLPDVSNVLVWLMVIVRNIIHLDEVRLRDARRNSRDPDNHDLRVRYLKNEITKEHFTKILRQRQKRAEEHRELLAIYEPLVTLASETMADLYHTAMETRGRIGILYDVQQSMTQPVLTAFNCIRDLSVTANRAIEHFSRHSRSVASKIPRLNILLSES